MSRLQRTFPHVFLAATALAVLLPMYFMVMAALKSDAEYADNKLGLPKALTLDNLRAVFEDPNLLTWAANSAVITGGSVCLTVAASLVAAYGIARGASNSLKRLLLPMVALLAIPPVILVVPLFSMFADLGLLNSRTGVVLIYGGLLTPLSIYLFTNYFETIPVDLDDAAVIDGAGRFQVLRYVILPLARPAILTVAVVSAVFVWNEFLIAFLFLQTEESQTLIVGLAAFQGRFSVDEPMLMAWSLIATVPIIVLYVFGQRYLVRGLTGGALK